MKCLPAVVSLPGLCLAGSVFAGSVLELESTEYYDEPPVVSTIQISTEGDSTRMEVTTVNDQKKGGESGGMIFRGDSREMVALDHQKKQYYILDEASMQQMATQMNSAMQEMQKALEGMPPEQRAMAEKMMKQHMPQGMQQAAEVPATLHETGEDDSVNGFDCDYYEVRRQDRLVRELCVTPWDDIPGGEGLADSMLEMAGFFERIAKAFSGAAGMNILAAQQEILALMQELDGYPVLTREFDEAGKVRSETVMQSASVEDVDPATFDPPAGYSEMQLGR